MGEPQPDKMYTVQEYLEFEASSEIRHEYEDGAILAMSGASINHGRISLNVASFLKDALRRSAKPCEAFMEQVKVNIDPSNAYVYPDIMVVCGELETAAEDDQSIINPTLIIEVLSESTENYDRGRKFYKYRKLPSLKEYILISQDSPEIEIYFKSEENTWELKAFHGLDGNILSRSLELEIPVSEVYYGVGWE